MDWHRILVVPSSGRFFEGVLNSYSIEIQWDIFFNSSKIYIPWIFWDRWEKPNTFSSGILDFWTLHPQYIWNLDSILFCLFSDSTWNRGPEMLIILRFTTTLDLHALCSSNPLSVQPFCEFLACLSLFVGQSVTRLVSPCGQNSPR